MNDENIKSSGSEIQTKANKFGGDDRAEVLVERPARALKRFKARLSGSKREFGGEGEYGAGR